MTNNENKKLSRKNEEFSRRIKDDDRIVKLGHAVKQTKRYRSFDEIKPLESELVKTKYAEKPDI